MFLGPPPVDRDVDLDRAVLETTKVSAEHSDTPDELSHLIITLRPSLGGSLKSSLIRNEEFTT